MSNSTSKNWHSQFDSQLVAWPDYDFVKKVTNYSITQERDVSYRFYQHAHAYVEKLLQKLLGKGTSGLQAADTEYHTRVELTGIVVAKAPDGTEIHLAIGEMVYLLEGTNARLTDGHVVRFAGSKVLDAFGAVVTLAANTSVIIPEKAVVCCANGSLVTLSHDGPATLTDGMPRPMLFQEFFNCYGPNLEMVPNTSDSPHPVKELDFTSSGAYSVYNWELFFHIPLTIAMHLSKNQRFAEGQRWFHYLFDPTDDSDGPTPERFWKVRPFQTTDVKKIEEILVNLVTGADERLRNETVASIEAWSDLPFRPHVVARYRQQAYMYKTVMAYLDNLIAWGDSLFRQDTGEAIDEALMLYILGANILGPRPQPVPVKGSVRPQTYDNLRKDLAQFGTVMREVEADIPFDLMPFPAENTGDNNRLAMVRSLGKALYFSVPANDRLLGYWDTIADRLFKIRNSLNIQGVFRQLALFEPPIDPALLARAAAAGLDVGAIVNGLNQPLPMVRFQLLVQKAAEIAQEVKSLGNNLLSAIEKEDGEALAILRARHERIVMEMVEHVKYAQLQEAIKSKEGLLKSLALAVQRYTYYERQLGGQADGIVTPIPGLDELDKDSLDKMKFAMEEPEVSQREIEVDLARDLGGSGGKIISSYEKLEIDKVAEARDLNETAAVKDKIAAGVSLLPELGIAFEFWGIGGNLSFGGSALSRGMSFWASFAKTDAEKRTYEASSASRIGNYSRREQDWVFQSNLAAGEIEQIFKQLRAAQICEAIAEQELENHRQQIKHAEEIEFFLTGEKGPDWTQKIDPKERKTANRALYAWMKREVKGLYSQCFQFAFDVARKAERALQHELGNLGSSYLQFGYLAGKEGLLAGEKLYLDIKHMEMTYHDLNQREYEMTKHVSLLQLVPLALLQLRATGRCTVQLPEALFDMDGPGHYFRRIKSLALSIPCVTGPYASVNCTLTLLKSSIRKTSVIGDGYARADAEDDRFSDYFGSLQSIVTSSAQNDSGLFETNLRDERYLPFENSGVISEWQLNLPADPSKNDPCQFNYDTISDVILHIRYTAREGGNLLRNEAVANLKAGIEAADKACGTTRLFSIRHEFQAEWAKFKRVEATSEAPATLSLNLKEEHYPFWSQGRVKSVARAELIASGVSGTISVATKPAVGRDQLESDPALGGNLWRAILDKAKPSQPTCKEDEPYVLSFDNNSMKDLWLALTWGG